MLTHSTDLGPESTTLMPCSWGIPLLLAMQGSYAELRHSIGSTYWMGSKSLGVMPEIHLPDGSSFIPAGVQIKPGISLVSLARGGHLDRNAPLFAQTSTPLFAQTGTPLFAQSHYAALRSVPLRRSSLKRLRRSSLRRLRRSSLRQVRRSSLSPVRHSALSRDYRRAEAHPRILC
jgi:hypothetical protein